MGATRAADVARTYARGVSPLELPTWTQDVRLVHEGRERSYLLHVPPGLPSPAPLVLELHGRGVDPLRFDYMTGLMASADERGFAVAAPSAIDEVWDDGRVERSDTPADAEFLSAVLDDVARRVEIDAAAIYATGMSNGAAMIGRLLCSGAAGLAGRFAAVAQVAGTVLSPVLASSDGAAPVPVLQIHGTADPYWPYDGGVPHGLRKRLFMGVSPVEGLGVDAWARRLNQASGDGSAVAMETVVSVDAALRRWHGFGEASELAFYRVQGGGHTWPGARITLPALIFGRTTHSFDATAEILTFFSRHRRKVEASGSGRAGSESA